MFCIVWLIKVSVLVIPLIVYYDLLYIYICEFIHNNCHAADANDTDANDDDE